MADMLKNPSKRQEFIMIHMTANLTVSVFWREAGWSASGGLKVSKESLDGLFHHICHVNNRNLMQLVSILST
jgi:hypothetical protein